MFAFSLMLLYKNEETLLAMQFDKLLDFLNTKVFEPYEVCLPKKNSTTALLKPERRSRPTDLFPRIQKLADTMSINLFKTQSPSG